MRAIESVELLLIILMEEAISKFHLVPDLMMYPVYGGLGVIDTGTSLLSVITTGRPKLMTVGGGVIGELWGAVVGPGAGEDVGVGVGEGEAELVGVGEGVGDALGEGVGVGVPPPPPPPPPGVGVGDGAVPIV